MNTVSITGRMGADVDLKTTPGGDFVANIRVAIRRDYKDKTTGEYGTDWVPVVLWRQSAEFAANFLGRGRLVAVSGRLQVREWEQDGQKRSIMEIVASHIEGLDKAPEGGARPAARNDEPPFEDPFSDE